MGDEEEEQQEQPPVEVLSDTGLFYLYYANDSGFAVSSSAQRDLTDDYFRKVDEAANEAQAERTAALVLQAFSRRQHARAQHGLQRHLILRLERAYRGHLGRLSFERAQLDRDRMLKQNFWDQNATLVQKMFRGFHSRKHKHNFYLRKHYLEQVAAKGEEIRVKVERHYQESKAVDEHLTAVRRMESFEKVVGSLHHMMSTSSCAGVYNSPYHQAVKPTVYGIHLEEHLENVARGTLRQTILRYGTNTGFVAHSPVSDVEGGTTAGGMGGGGEMMATTAGGGGGLYAYSTKPIQISRAH